MSKKGELIKVRGRNIDGLTIYTCVFESAMPVQDMMESLTRKRNIVAKMGIQVEDITRIPKAKPAMQGN